MEIATDTAVVMATHDGQAFLQPQLESILAQTLLPAVLTIVDDGSRDETRAIVREFSDRAPFRVELLPLVGTPGVDPRIRIARAMSLGLTSVAGHAFILLADQDDEWLPGRLAGQRSLLHSGSDIQLVAGDGVLIDATGTEVGGTLRDRFPVPDGWATMSAAARVAAAIRQPFVTGATCALRADLVPLLTPVPAGWHIDRWATLVAAARGSLEVQLEAVIRYRVHAGQTTGLGGAAIGRGQQRWRQVLGRGATILDAARRSRDVVNRIRPLAIDPGVRRELSWPAIVRGAFDRSAPDPSRSEGVDDGRIEWRGL